MSMFSMINLFIRRFEERSLYYLEELSNKNITYD